MSVNSSQVPRVHFCVFACGTQVFALETHAEAQAFHMFIQYASHPHYVTLALRRNTSSRMMMTSEQHVAPERKDKRVVAPWR
jgi:hypothetical protein